jgi:LacI family transcriptional regulator
MASIRALARSLRLAPSTVSRALGGSSAISVATRARVLAAASIQGGGGLRAGLSGRRLIAVLRRVDGATRDPRPCPYVDSTLAGLGAGAAELGVELGHVACTGAIAQRLAEEPTHLTTLLGRRPDGLVLWGWAEEAALRPLAMGWPCVSLLFLPHAQPVVQLTLDHAQAVGVLLDHLLGLGHRAIGFVCGIYPDGRGSERLGAFVGACHRRGIAWKQRWLITCTGEARDARRLVAATRGGVEAWIADSHAVGEMAWRHLTEAGVRIPQDCSLASFAGADPSPGCPLLTRVSGPFSTMGRLAVGLLLSPWERSRPACRLQMAVELEAGTTTAPSARRWQPADLANRIISQDS